MMEQNPVQGVTEQALYLLAEKRQELAFNDLLEYASKICLKNPPLYLTEKETSHYETGSVEQRLVQHIGARGLIGLIDFENGAYQKSFKDFSDYDPAEILTAPTSYSGKQNYRILENAERFGQALIDESFAVLGKGANRQAEKLRDATTPDQEYDIINWLSDRLHAINVITRPDNQEENEALHFFPPQRLSPKLIGSFPDTQLLPSCLSLSIIATSFFQKAGVESLHAGITTPSTDIGSYMLKDTISSLFAEKSEEPSFRQKAVSLYKLHKKAEAWTQKATAQHAAVYARLSTGWVQFDVGYGASAQLNQETSQRLDTIKTTIDEWRPLLPNIELAGNLYDVPRLSYTTTETGTLNIVLERLEYPDRDELAARIDHSLKEMPDEAYVKYLYDLWATELYSADRYKSYDDDPGEKHIAAIVLSESQEEKRQQSSDHYEAYLYQLFETAFRAHVMWGESDERFITKCRADEAYRKRRAEDIIDLTKSLTVVNSILASKHDPGLAHMALDIGSPAMRIGLATLNDFAIYDNYPLPASFWTTHWPGMVSAVENIDNPAAGEIDRSIIHNALVAEAAHPFTSDRNYDKITGFLSANYESSDQDESESGKAHGEEGA